MRTPCEPIRSRATAWQNTQAQGRSPSLARDAPSHKCRRQPPLKYRFSKKNFNCAATSGTKWPPERVSLDGITPAFQSDHKLAHLDKPLR